MSAQPAKPVLSRKDAADYLDVSLDTLDRRTREGQIPASRVSPRLVKYRITDLNEYLERCQIINSSSSRTRPTGTSSGSSMDTQSALRRAREIARKLNRS